MTPGPDHRTPPDREAGDPPALPRRPAWIEVDLDAIAANTAAVKRCVGSRTDVMAVVKANAYGHGLVQAAGAALRGGATALGVALPEEGLELRSAGVLAPILVLGVSPPEAAESLVAAHLAQILAGTDTAEALSRASQQLGRPARGHLKIDTGMGRIGVLPEHATSVAVAIVSLPGVRLEGVATHIAWEAGPDMPRAVGQITCFTECLGALKQRGICPRWRHAANSEMTVQMPQCHFDMVRVGLLIYGIPPTGGSGRMHLGPALALKARITQIKIVRPGHTISYGGTFTARRPSTVGVVPLGYADGYPRRMSNRGEVLIRGCRCPVIGAVCMDQIVVDVTDVPGVKLGQEVVLLGRQGNDEVTVGEVARRIGGITHEVVSQLGVRLPRVWKGQARSAV